MKKLQFLLSKQNVLFIGILGTLMALGLTFSWKIGLCGIDSYTCIDQYQTSSVSFDVFVFLLFFSLATYKLNETVFSAWRRFASFWVPLTIFLTAISSSEGGNSIPFPSLKGIVDVFMISVFILVSIIIILSKLYSNRRNKSS